jgi:hypothetical protein
LTCQPPPPAPPNHSLPSLPLSPLHRPKYRHSVGPPCGHCCHRPTSGVPTPLVRTSHLVRLISRAVKCRHHQLYTAACLDGVSGRVVSSRSTTATHSSESACTHSVTHWHLRSPPCQECMCIMPVHIRTHTSMPHTIRVRFCIGMPPLAFASSSRCTNISHLFLFQSCKLFNVCAASRYLFLSLSLCLT